MINTIYVMPEQWFYSGFFVGMFVLEFFLFIAVVYQSIIKIKLYKKFLLENKLHQKFEEFKDNNRRFNRW